jgi:hypothetical protein
MKAGEFATARERHLRAGVSLLFWAFDKIGPKGTYEEFWGALNGSADGDPSGEMVARISLSESRGRHNKGFEQARNFYFKEHRLGHKFVMQLIPTAARDEHIVAEVLISIFGEKQEAETKKRAATRTFTTSSAIVHTGRNRAVRHTSLNGTMTAGSTQARIMVSSCLPRRPRRRVGYRREPLRSWAFRAGRYRRLRALASSEAGSCPSPGRDG